jgi:hypothetical protein
MSGLSDAAAVVTAATAVVAVAGSYVQFVLKRLVLPSAQFDVEFTPYVRGSSQLVGEVTLVFKNVGSTTLIVKDVRSRIRFRLQSDAELQAPNDLAEPQFYHNLTSYIPGVTASQPSISQVISSQPEGSHPQLSAPSSIAVSGQPQASTEVPPRGWLTLVRERTFIQPGVTQYYRKPIGLPANARLVHIWRAFDYKIRHRPREQLPSQVAGNSG